MGKREVRQMFTAARSGWGHRSTGPSGVCAQSKARISRAISLSPGKMRSSAIVSDACSATSAVVIFLLRAFLFAGLDVRLIVSLIIDLLATTRAPGGQGLCK